MMAGRVGPRMSAPISRRVWFSTRRADFGPKGPTILILAHNGPQKTIIFSSSSSISMAHEPPYRRKKIEAPYELRFEKDEI